MQDLHTPIPPLDVVFFSCAAVTSDGWVQDAHLREVEAKRQLLRAARHWVLLVDHTKFARRAGHDLKWLTDVGTVVVDQGVPSGVRGTLADGPGDVRQ